MKKNSAINAQWVIIFISSSSRSKQLTSRSRVCRVVESLILTSSRDIPLQSRRAKVYTYPRIVSVVQSCMIPILPPWVTILHLIEIVKNIGTHRLDPKWYRFANVKSGFNTFCTHKYKCENSTYRQISPSTRSMYIGNDSIPGIHIDLSVAKRPCNLDASFVCQQRNVQCSSMC